MRFRARPKARASTIESLELAILGGAGDGNRNRMTSLEGWGSTIELRPRSGSRRRLQHTGPPGGSASRLNLAARSRSQAGTRLPGPAVLAGRG